jgi:hypothetical protein
MPSRKATRPTDKRLSAHRPHKPVVKTRMQMLIDGDISVDDLDDEEVMAGRVKDKNGKFTGRPRDLLPRKISDEMRRRWHALVQEQLNDQTELAILTLQDIMASRMAAAPARVRAAEIILERNLGKVPDKIESQVVVRKFEDDIEGLLIDAGEHNVYEITSAKVKGKDAG